MNQQLLEYNNYIILIPVVENSSAAVWTHKTATYLFSVVMCFVKFAEVKALCCWDRRLSETSE